MIRVGSLCSGYGGLEAAVRSVLPSVEVAFHAEVDPAASRVLKSAAPDVPNLGDLRLIDWSAPDLPVDLLTLGVPCQPASYAGDRAAEGDPRWLWPDARRAIRELRPPAFLFENVEGLVTLRGGEVWRGILADMRAEGYAVRWLVMGACVVGACHHRHRVFALGAYVGPAGPPAVKLDVPVCDRRPDLIATPRARDSGVGGGGGPRLTPRMDRRQGGPATDLVTAVVTEFDRYAVAVERWAQVCGIDPPEPTETGPRGGVRLAPAFPAWMMGVPFSLFDGESRTDTLRMIGNGVMPAQGARAIELLLGSA